MTLFVDSSLSDNEESVKQEAANVITNYFSYSRFGFADAFIPQDLNREIFNLSNVRYSTVDNVKDTINVDYNEVIQLNNVTINVTFI